MKLLHFLAFLLIGSCICFAAEIQVPVHPDKTPVHPVFQQDIKTIKQTKDKLQALNINVLDSMANCYAYFGANNAFSAEPNGLGIGLIRRGFVDLLKNSFYTGKNQKNNLFVKRSTDWGQTWDEGTIVYDEKEYTYDQARYPSVAVYSLSGRLAISFTAATVIETANKWTGVISGYYDDNEGGYVGKFDSSFKFNNNLYKWGIQAKLAAHTTGAAEELMVYAADGVSPISGDLADASNIAFRSTTDFTTQTNYIPTAWASGKFGAVTLAGYRANEVVGLKYGKNGLYMAAHGNFLANDVAGRPTVGVSQSADEGKTWSEFDVFPFSIARAYASSQGANPDSCIIPYTTKDFTVLDNGDFSFVALFSEYNAAKKYTDAMHDIIEIYKENGAWGVRKVASIYGSWMVYRDYLDGNGNATNPNDIELQIARTPDGKHIFAKWVDLIGVKDTVDQLNRPYTTYRTTDIFVASREIGKPKWFGPINATNSDLKDRTTLIPDYVPNSLLGIPFISTATIVNPNYSSQQKSLMVDSSTAPQYILLQLYDHIVGVEESSNITSMNLLGVYPNPATGSANIDFTLENDANVDVSIYNLVGQKVLQVYSGFQTMGFHSVNFNVGNLPMGTYSCTINQKGFTKSKLINVIR